MKKHIFSMVIKWIIWVSAVCEITTAGIFLYNICIFPTYKKPNTNGQKKNCSQTAVNG